MRLALNIVHVVESLDVGGLERVVLSLATWQRAHGGASRIICLFHEGPLGAEARASGIRVDVVNKAPGLDLRALRVLRRLLLEENVDILHTHNPVAHYYAAGAAAATGIGRIVNTRHGMGSSHESRQLRLLYRAALTDTAKVVAVCRAARDRFVEAGTVPADKAAVIANGIAIDFIVARNTAAKDRLLSLLKRPRSAFLIGTVGRLNAVKSHQTLLHAIQRLRGAGRSVDLLVVGDGETRAALEAEVSRLQLRGCVHFLGMRPDVAELLPALDVFALPSLSEGYSLALVEAATAALPIVATKVGGNGEIVDHGVTGLLVSPGDADEMAGAIAQLIDDPERRDRMGRAGRAWALKAGSIDAMGRAYESLYRGGQGTFTRVDP